MCTCTMAYGTQSQRLHGQWKRWSDHHLTAGHEICLISPLLPSATLVCEEWTLVDEYSFNINTSQHQQASSIGTPKPIRRGLQSAHDFSQTLWALVARKGLTYIAYGWGGEEASGLSGLVNCDVALAGMHVIGLFNSSYRVGTIPTLWAANRDLTAVRRLHGKLPMGAIHGGPFGSKYPIPGYPRILLPLKWMRRHPQRLHS